VADLEPPRWLTRLTASHPPTVERIGAAVAFAQRSGDQDDGGHGSAVTSAAL
jgi:hypothetical protein